jgi:uncharacterized membrane protein
MSEAPKRYLRYTAEVSLISLVVLTLAWELWLAPLRPAGSWLALKTLPLVLPLAGVINGNIYTFRWAMMLVLAYFAEGSVRAYTEQGVAAALASVELVLALAFFVAAIAYVRLARTGSALTSGKSTGPA